ncbi:ParA family protein [Saccharopolyspora pogona]|uniref:ParA family protein n=1 Tax=Saccharopolyspora pogona TaxID=333966 RepID=UPI0016864BB9|nr:ParA family protein [Saccharopolyspora pogona]
MAYKVAVCQNKGGVGKTNEVINLAVGLVVEHDLRVRVVDLDPQSDASAALGFEVDGPEDDAITVLEVIERAWRQHRLVTGTAADAIQQCRWDVPWRDKLTFIPSRFDLEDAHVVMPNRDAFLRLRAGMEGTDDDVDVLIYDCPPSLGILPQMAWADSDDVLLVTQPSFRSYRGLFRTHAQLLYVREQLLVPDLDYVGLIINGHRSGTQNHKYWERRIVEEFASGQNEGKHWGTVPLRARLARLDDELLPVALMPETDAKERELKAELTGFYRPAVDRLHKFATTTVTEEV